MDPSWDYNTMVIDVLLAQFNGTLLSGGYMHHDPLAVLAGRQ